jgi:hypothetical protein
MIVFTPEDREGGYSRPETMATLRAQYDAEINAERMAQDRFNNFALVVLIILAVMIVVVLVWRQRKRLAERPW